MLIINDGFVLSLEYRVYSSALIQCMNAIGNDWLESSYDEEHNCFSFIAILDDSNITSILKDNVKNSNIRINLATIRNDVDFNGAIEEMKKLYAMYKKKGVTLDKIFNKDRLNVLANEMFFQKFNKQDDIINFLIESNLIKFFQPTIKLIKFSTESMDSYNSDVDDEDVEVNRYITDAELLRQLQ